MGVQGQVAEVFSSIQGEGLLLGCRQVFVRLAGCSYGCRYCDQAEARRSPARARCERRPGTGDFALLPNPVSAEELVRRALALDSPPGLHQAFSITGGEPLEQTAFLLAVLPALRAGDGHRVLLETNGVLAEELGRVIGLVDIISMDYKLATATGIPAPASEHARFLAIAAEKQVFVKIVVAAGTTEEEVVAAALAIGGTRSDIPLVLQPVSRVPGGPAPPSAARLLVLHAAAAGSVQDVRIIAQMHPDLGLL